MRDTERSSDWQAPRPAAKKENRTQDRDPNLSALETKLRRRLGTQVKVAKEAGSERGKILIEFYSLTDLNRIAAVLSNTESAPGAV